MKHLPMADVMDMFWSCVLMGRVDLDVAGFLLVSCWIPGRCDS